MRSIRGYCLALVLLSFICTVGPGQESNGKGKGGEDGKGQKPSFSLTDHNPHLDVAIILTVIALSGAIGGFATGIGSQRSNEITIPGLRKTGTPHYFRLGFMGDMFIGMAASFAVHFVFDPIADNKPTSLEMHYLLRAISLGVLAGFTGIKVLTTISDAITQQLRNNRNQIMDEVKTENRSDELLVFTENSLKEVDGKAATDAAGALSDLNNFELGIDQLLAQTPNNTRAMVVKAKIFRRRWEYSKTDPSRKQFLLEAIKILTAAVSLDPTYDRAHYNRACYSALLGNVDDAMRDLQQAITLFFQNRFFAQQDPDLVSLHTHKDWKKVVEGV